jgi:hypothetical protein
VSALRGPPKTAHRTAGEGFQISDDRIGAALEAAIIYSYTGD